MVHMFRKVILSLILFIPSSIYGQQVIRAGASTFGDTETNRTFSQFISATDTSNINFTKIVSIGNMLANDSVGNYNYQYIRIGVYYKDSVNFFVNGDIGIKRLYSSTSGDRYQPIGFISTGVMPIWTNKHPYGLNFRITYDAFDEIGQYIRDDIQFTSLAGVGEVYLWQQVWIQAVVNEMYLSDTNNRFTTDLTVRYLTLTGFFYGVRAYYQTYKFDAGTLYWSPELYEVLMGQVGYKFRWDNPTWDGSVSANAGVEKIDNNNATFLWIVNTDVSKKVSNRTWIRGWGAYSNGNSIVSTSPDYRSWILGIGVRVSR